MRINRSGIGAGIFSSITLALQLLPSVHAAPVLLASYSMNGDANDSTGNSPPMELFNTSFVSNALFMPVDPTNWHGASARINGLSYEAFTVAVDFKPTSATPHWGEAILYGGISYRWLGFVRINDHLRVELNGLGPHFDFLTAQLETNRWHRLVCSVDLASQRIITFLDALQLAAIELNSFAFEPVGTEHEPSEKVFSFQNGGNGSTFHGFADNLQVFNQALTPAEITALFFPRVDCVRSGSTLLLHWPVVEMDGFVIESTPAFSTTNLWTPVMPAPVVIGDRYVVQQDLGGPARFFRLRK